MSQVIQFGAPSGLSGVTASLFVPGSDAIIATAAGAEMSNARGKYLGSFSGLPLQIYQLIAFNPARFPLADWLVKIDAASGIFLCYDGSSVADFADSSLSHLKSYITGVVAIVRGPVSADEFGALTMSITIGDDYSATDQRQIEIDLDGTALPDLTTASVELHLQTGKSVVIVPGTITVPTGTTRTVRFQPTAAETALLTITMDGRFSIVLTVSTRTITPPEGRGVLTAVMRIVACN